MTAAPELTGELRKLVLDVEVDLRERLAADAPRHSDWKAEHKTALEAGRTSSSWEAWRDDRVTQAAVAWVLTTVFVRFCEDNALINGVWISGPGAKAQEAMDAELDYFRAHPEHTYREWTLRAVDHLKAMPSTAALVEDHSPLWQVQPSGNMAQAILDYWRETGPDGARLRDLSDPELSTRFLGDLYQDLSDYAKKTFALLQTPEFVEEFILDQTLTPALKERPLEGFKLIDPTCGSGHFLLGAFQRMLAAWEDHAPNLEPRVRVQNALNAIHGVDLNPFAIAISKFRLTVAALKAEGSATLENAPAFTYHLAAGDSLLYGKTTRPLNFEGFDLDAQASGFAYSTEDRSALDSLLAENQYDVVVGNPPYITVKDKTLNERYRQLYKTCKGKYALTVPFMERFFGLAKHGSRGQIPGWTGQITSNSFMKREFGSKIIEDYLSRQDLRLVADTSGAYIPGHGTPTVIIVGRHQSPVASTVRAVLGVRGEPGRPEDPEKGLVWQAIVSNVDDPTHNDQWVSVTDLPRLTLATHPWSLSGGGATDLLALIEERPSHLSDIVESIGFAAITGDDAVFVGGETVSPMWRRSGVPVRPFVEGDRVRDFSIQAPSQALFPFQSGQALNGLGDNEAFWPYRTGLRAGLAFQQTREERGLNWYEYILPNWPRLNADTLITFAFVATHNHFVLDRGGKVFKQSAPVIKLPEGASEDDHLALLGVLSSSTACFWLKQNSHRKASAGMGGGMIDQPWSWNYEFTGTTLQDFPLPGSLPLNRGRALDGLARHAADVSPAHVVGSGTPSADSLAEAQQAYASLRGQMIAQQEELDWETYRLYGLLDEDLTFSGEVPEVALGERAFEIALARKVADGDEDTAWFARHGSTPITEIPSHWPDDYKALVQCRLDLIELDPNIRLLEKPEFKRRWASEPWGKQQERALRGLLLDRLEDKAYWFDSYGRPAPRSIGQLADLVAKDADLVSVLELWSETKDVDVVKALTALLTDEAVPYLAAQRLKDSGLRNREAWEKTWDLQRREDAGEDVGTIAVPPKYATADFRKASYWQARGKLDVPKERFILYPDAGRQTDPTLLIGWAGWNHAEQFLALATIQDQRTDEGAEPDKLAPLVAGMNEVLPWVKQWHQDVDPTYGTSMALFCAEQFEERRTALGVTTQALAAWRPAAPTRGRRAKSATAPATSSTEENA
jgi:hypothetical protein